MIKTQVYLNEEELSRLQKLAKKAKRSVADLVRDAIRKTWFRSSANGPIALWDKPIPRSSVEHDSIYDDI